MSEFLIDTSVWIEFFQAKKKAVKDFLWPLIDEDRVHYNGIILGELLLGTPHPKEFEFLKENFEGFKYHETDKGIFEEAGRIGYMLRRKGISAPLSGLIITAHAIQNDLVLVTRDPLFQSINEFLPLNLKFMQ